MKEREKIGNKYKKVSEVELTIKNFDEEVK